MIEIDLITLFSGTKARGVLKQGINHSNFDNIYKQNLKKNLEIYLSSQPYAPHYTNEDCFLKDIIGAVEYTDYALDSRFKKFTRKDIKLDNYSDEYIACFLCCIFKIVFDAYGKRYIRGLHGDEIHFIKQIEIDVNSDSVNFDDEQVAKALEVLGEIRRTSKPSFIKGDVRLESTIKKF